MHRSARRIFISVGALALFATAMVAPTMAAASGSVHSGAESTILEGKQSGVAFEIPKVGFQTTCSNTTFSGTMAGSEATELTLHPVYNKEEKTCLVNSLVNATVKSTGCNLTLSGAPKEGESAGSLAISCEAGHAIEISMLGKCTVSIGSQTVSGFHYGNQGNWPTLSLAAKIEASGIKYTSSNCQSYGIPSSGSDGAWANQATLSGYESEGGKAGSQTSLWVSSTPLAFHNSAINGKAVLTGSGSTSFFANDQYLISCGSTAYSGSMSASTASALTLHPVYNNGEKTCGGGIKVTSQGCDFQLASDFLPGPGSVGIVCEAGKMITLTVNACTVNIGSQSGLHSATYYTSQSGGPGTRSIHGTLKLQGVHYTTSAGGQCGIYYGIGNGESRSDGYIESEFTVNGKDESGQQVGVFIE